MSQRPDEIPDFNTLSDEETLDYFRTHSKIIDRLDKDLRLASKTLSDQEVAYLINNYYAVQQFRVIAGNRAKALQKVNKPNLLSEWIENQSWALERAIHIALDQYGQNHPLGAWPRSIFGIGPVLTAGLLANTNWNHLTSPSHLWSFAGLNPNMKWERGQKRPFNADLKVLCYKIGESFVKVQNSPKDFYGKKFVTYKQEYTMRNDRGDYKERSEDIIKSNRFGKTTQAYGHYLAGHLPPAHVHAMARRKTVKLFLSHYWQVSYEIHHQRKAPHLYVEVYLQHVDIIPPPNWTGLPKPLIPPDYSAYNLERPFS